MLVNTPEISSNSTIYRPSTHEQIEGQGYAVK